MKCWLSFFLLILLFTGCIPRPGPSDYKPNPANGIVDELEKKVLLQLKREKALQPFEFGGGAGKKSHCILSLGIFLLS